MGFAVAGNKDLMTATNGIKYEFGWECVSLAAYGCSASLRLETGCVS